ncbi:MAG: serine/threonine-protein kinase [Cyanobacteria bacterium J06642_11]
MGSVNLVGASLQKGKYVIEAELGHGGFGVTYRAIRHPLNQQVVIKTLRWPEIASNQSQQLKQFEDEARRLARCQHPHIVKVTDFFVEAGQPYLVMDFIPGQPLSAMIFPRRPLAEARALHYIRQIADALQTVHQQGLLHRDIKPQNIMIAGDKAVLIDFGIARELTSGQTQTHTNLVSEGYAPLEQYLPKARRSAASDVYGLAGTLYSAVTGEVPVASVLRSHQPLPSPRQFNPQLSQVTEQAILQGMALELPQRPQSVATWLRLLDPKTRQSRRGPQRQTTQATQVVAPAPPSGIPLEPATNPTVAAPRPAPTRPRRQGPGFFKTLFSLITLGLLAGLGFVGYRAYIFAQNTWGNFQEQAANLPEVKLPEVTLPEVNLPDLEEILPEDILVDATSTPTDVKLPVEIPEAVPEAISEIVESVSPKLPLILRDSGNPGTAAAGGGGVVTVPGFAPGTRTADIVNRLGTPTRESASADATTAVYELAPNRASVAYVYDAAKETVKQTEAVFAPSYDRLVMRSTLTGMLNWQSTQAIENGLEQVRTGALDRYPFEHNGLSGSIERNRNGFIHMYVR